MKHIWYLHFLNFLFYNYSDYVGQKPNNCGACPKWIIIKNSTVIFFDIKTCMIIMSIT